MTSVIELRGSYAEEKELLEQNQKENPVYVLNEPGTRLCQYIDYMHDELELPNRIVNRLRICKEYSLERAVTVYTSEGILAEPATMSELLRILEPGTPYQIVVEDLPDGHDRWILAELIQQFVYVDYPLEELGFSLRREFKDKARTNRFMRGLSDICDAAARGVCVLSQIPLPADADEEEKAVLRDTAAIYAAIQAEAEKARDVTVTIAVAASKKTGKSVIVNSMIRQELAPTSLETATPNTVTYVKSPDDRYRLHYEGRTSTYEDGRELYKHMYRLFKKAEHEHSDEESAYALEDMTIEYVGTNSFEEKAAGHDAVTKFVIQDTPGPDLAGQDKHRESAERAMSACDVAIFAIDYTKYLTDDEVRYLKFVRRVFENKKKFYTLLFDLNKMDEALQDKGAKSRVKSIDFIRGRLIEIVPEFRDCILFATSAKDYFRTIEARNAAKTLPELAKAIEPGAPLTQTLRGFLRSNEGEISESLDEELYGLEREADQVERVLRWKDVDLRAVEQFSGMPQLMSYASYIAESKAREEILNSITFRIDELYLQLRRPLERISAIEASIGETDEKIAQATSILEEYEKDVDEILRPAISLRELPDDSWLKTTMHLYKAHHRQGQDGGAVSLVSLFGACDEWISPPDEEKIYEEIWDQASELLKTKLKSLKGKVTDVSNLELSNSAFQEICENVLEGIREDEYQQYLAQIDCIRRDLTNLLARRSEQMKERSRECQKELDASGIQLTVPEQPAFTPALPKLAPPELDSANLRIPHLAKHLSGAYNDLWAIHKFFRDILGMSEGSHEVTVGWSGSLDDHVDSIRSAFFDELRKSNIYSVFEDSRRQLAGQFEPVAGSVLHAFGQMMGKNKEAVRNFRRSIDRRDEYMRDQQKLEREKDFILQVERTSQAFANLWNDVTGRNPAAPGEENI